QVLQRSGYGGAMDQGGRERPEVDAAVVPPIQGQPGPSAIVRLGVQPGELPAAAGVAPVGADLDADDAAREADQDRREGGASRPGSDVPAGGGGGPARAVRGAPGWDRSAARGAGPRVIVHRRRMRVA